MDEQRWLTTVEAAERLGKTDRQVRRDCHNEILNCKRDGKQLLVDVDSVEALLQKQMSEPEECPQEDVREAPEDEEVEDTDIDEDTDTQEEDITDIQQTSDMDEDITPALPYPPLDMPPEEASSESPFADIEKKELQQAVVEVKEALKERLDTENRCIARVENVLAHLDRKYCAERKRNRKAQEILKSLLAELQVPLAENKPSLLRRLFSRR